jgi:hypothetical protein
MDMAGEYARLSELKTRNELKKQPSGDTGLINGDDLQDIENNELEED